MNVNITLMNQFWQIYQQRLYPTKADNIKYIRSFPTIREKTKNNLNEQESYLLELFCLILIDYKKLDD